MNVLTAHAQTLSSQKVTENGVARPKWPRHYRKMGALTSNFKPEVVMWSKLRMRGEKSPNYSRKQRRKAKHSTSYRKLMSLNSFSVTDLRPEAKLVHLLSMRRHWCHVWDRRHWTDSEFAWTLSWWRRRRVNKQLLQNIKEYINEI